MSFDEMFRYVSEQKFDGIAVAQGDDREYYLAFQSGEPEGAMYIGEQGALYGDSAAMLIPENQVFCLHKIKAGIVSPIIMGCRLFEKPFIRTPAVNLIPRIGAQSAGIGVLNLVLM